MQGATTQQRINDICRRTGLTENVVRRVIDAECESVAESLSKGERVNIIGRCTIYPEISSVIENSKLKYFIRLKAKATKSLEEKVRSIKVTEEANTDTNENILVEQIEDLI